MKDVIFMKKIFITILLVLIIVFANISYSYAAQPVKNILGNQSIDNDINKSDIEKAFDTSFIKPKEALLKEQSYFNILKDKNIDKDDFAYGKPYKVYYFKDYYKALNSQKISDLIADDEYYWEIPIYLKENNNLNPASNFDVECSKATDYKWDIIRVNSYLSARLSDLCSKPEEVAQFLQKQGITDADTVIHFGIPYTYDFLYVLSNGKEYFIPMFDYESEINGLKSLNVYTREQFFNGIKPILASDAPKDFTGGFYTGKPKAVSYDKTDSAKSKDVKNRLPDNIVYIAVLGSIGLISGGILLYRRRIK